MINNVVLVGRLTKECDLRYTSSGVAVATFNLAVNRNFVGQSGAREADFISCVIWRKLAETFATYTKKGSLVGIVGRLQTRNYENQNGQRVYVTEVIVEQIQFLDSKSPSDTKQKQIQNQQTPPQYGKNGFARPDREEPIKNTDYLGGQPIHVSEDELPF